MTPPVEGNGVDGADEDPDLGTPVAELREMSLPLGDRFVGRVRGRIERQMLTGELLELLCVAPVKMLFEFLRWPFETLSRDRQ